MKEFGIIFTGTATKERRSGRAIFRVFSRYSTQKSTQTKSQTLYLRSNSIMFRSFFFLTIALIATLAQAGTNAEGLKFLAAKEKEDGVVKLPSGLLYKGSLSCNL